ncbi:MAG: hypothetical protein ABIJ09_26025 [Pseudomonadota bacterium]
MCRRLPILRLFLAVTVASLVACADAELMGRYAPYNSQVFEPVSTLLRRTAPTVLDSSDGQVRVEIPPLAVHAPVTITLSRVVSTDPATGESWTAYQLEPFELELERPARLSMSQATLPSRSGREDLRLARLLDDRPEAIWQALERPQASSSQVLGRTTRFGLFAVQDVTRVQVVGSQPFTSTSEADVLLSRGQVQAARAAYAAVAARNPEDARALMGQALTSLLLLAEHSSVRNLLARCELPPLGEASLFGDGGYLQRLATDRDGEAELGLEFGLSTTPLEVESVVAHAGARWLRVQVEDRDHIDGPWTLSVNIDLAAAGDRFAFGQDIPAHAFPGDIELQSPIRTLRVGLGSMGQIHVEEAGRGADQELALRFDGVTLVDENNQLVRMTGSLHDILRRAPVPPHPLFETDEDEGPPHRARFARLLDGCSQAFTAPFVFAQVQGLRGELDLITAGIRAALSHSSGNTLEPALSAFLLHTDADLLLDRRDGELLVQLLEGVQLSLDLAAPYRWLGYDASGESVALGSFLDTLSWAFDDPSGSVGQRDERVLSFQLLAQDLNRNLFGHDAGPAALVQALAPLREPLRLWLQELDGVLGHSASSPGLFDLDHVDAQDLIASLRQLLLALRDTLPDGATPVNAPASPGYQVLARRWFEAPLEHASLSAASTDGELFVVQPGDPEATTAAARNPTLVASPALLDSLEASVLLRPVVPPDTVCSDDVECPGTGLRCGFAQGQCAVSAEACAGSGSCTDGSSCLGLCERQPFELVSQQAWRRALDGDHPAMLTAPLWRLLQPLWEELPRP